MSIFSLTFFGFMPVGSLITGAVAERLGPTITVVLGSLIILIFAIAAWLFIPRLRTLE